MPLKTTPIDALLAARTPTPALVNARQTRTTQLLAQLRSEIITGRLAPDERLVLSTLCEQFGAGQTPLREALLRLASEGLVVQEEQRGFSVAPVSREELLDLTASRAEVDALALRWSIENGDDHWEAQLLGTFHRLQKGNKINGDGHSIDMDWQSRHTDFHAALVAACPSCSRITSPRMRPSRRMSSISGWSLSVRRPVGWLAALSEGLVLRVAVLATACAVEESFLLAVVMGEGKRLANRERCAGRIRTAPITAQHMLASKIAFCDLF